MNFTDLEYVILGVLADSQKKFWTEQDLRVELRTRKVPLPSQGPSEPTLYDIVERLRGFVDFRPLSTTKHRSFTSLHLTHAGRDKVAELREGR